MRRSVKCVTVYLRPSWDISKLEKLRSFIKIKSEQNQVNGKKSSNINCLSIGICILQVKKFTLSAPIMDRKLETFGVLDKVLLTRLRHGRETCWLVRCRKDTETVSSSSNLLARFIASYPSGAVEPPPNLPRTSCATKLNRRAITKGIHPQFRSCHFSSMLVDVIFEKLKASSQKIPLAGF